MGARASHPLFLVYSSVVVQKVGRPRSQAGRQSAMAWVAGTDGCRAGWMVAFASVNDDGIGVRDVFTVRIRVLTKFADIFAAPEQPRVVAVDIPIGLPA